MDSKNEQPRPTGVGEAWANAAKVLSNQKKSFERLSYSFGRAQLEIKKVGNSIASVQSALKDHATN